MRHHIQFLWQDIDPSNGNVYNGGVEAVLAFLAVCGAFAAGYINNDIFIKWGCWFLTGCSLIQGCLLLMGALADNVWVSYVSYIFFGTLYHFMVTVSRFVM